MMIDKETFSINIDARTLKERLKQMAKQIEAAYNPPKYLECRFIGSSKFMDMDKLFELKRMMNDN